MGYMGVNSVRTKDGNNVPKVIVAHDKQETSCHPIGSYATRLF